MNLQPEDPRATEFVRVLRLARRRLQRGQDIYVCDAIGAVAGSYHPLIKWISEGIRPYLIVSAWLRDQRPALVTDLTYEVMRDYRMRWINHMIKYFGGEEEQR